MSTATFFQGKSVLITGASSGIGEEMAIQLASLGAQLTLAARRVEQLEALAQKIALLGGPKPVVGECDVTRDGDLELAVGAAVAAFGRLDIAVANAGFGVVGALQKLTVDDYRRQFETNVFGVLRTIYAALPELEKAHGNFVVVSSVAGWVSTPGSSPYAMSKFALRALASSITPELRRSNVKVTLISPGFVVSNIRRVDNAGNFHARAEDSIPPWLAMSTPTAVRPILGAVARGKREQIITLHGKVFVFIERFLPWINRALAGRIARRPRQ
jgi:short-subunit dehydrogenase